MEALIHTGRCDRCGRDGSLARRDDGDSWCRVCDPVSWERVAEEDKNRWLTGENQNNQ